MNRFKYDVNRNVIISYGGIDVTLKYPTHKELENLYQRHLFRITNVVEENDMGESYV